MKKSGIILIVVCAALVVFVAMSAKVIDKGTESQYTGEVAFDANASSGDDWDAVLAEIAGKAEDIAALDLSALGDGRAVALKGTVTGFESKANGKKNTITVAPEGYSGDAVFTVQLGSIYSGTAIRDTQTVKAFGDFTNQTEWSAYAKALNSEMHEKVVAPLAIDEGIQGKTVTITGAATGSGKDINITPVAVAIE